VAARKPKTPATPLPTKEEAVQRYAVLDQAIRRPGPCQLDELESALGMYVLGWHVGWRVLHIIHSKKTIRKYEDFLGIKIAETFPEYGPDADRTNAFRIIQGVSNFWKAVSGEEKPAFTVDKKLIDDKGT
jgi:hypothetical protein